jgi:TPR repeat protein
VLLTLVGLAVVVLAVLVARSFMAAQSDISATDPPATALDQRPAGPEPPATALDQRPAGPEALALPPPDPAPSAASSSAAAPSPSEYLESLSFDNWQQRREALAQGLRHYFGQGVPQDFLAARRYFEQAAPGEGRAAYYLGKMYAEGSGVTRDALLSVQWFAKGAERGDMECQFALGMVYLRGEPGILPPDPGQAARWLSAAAAQGHQEANTRLKELGRPPRSV